MKTKLTLEVSEAELEYRTKHYHDLRALKQRDLSCTSCGNALSQKSEEIFAHPVFTVIQCRKCNDHVKSVLNSEDSSTSCEICAVPRNSLYECSKKNCPYKFCQACIKRNAPRSLLEAESNNWKCLACNPKPLWKLRGACTAVMSSISKRTKRKKVSRNKSSDTDDEKTNLKNVSYVRSRQLAETMKLRKRLRTVCDNDSPIQITEPSCSSFDKNRRGTKQDSNSTNEKIGNFGNALTVVTSSENSDIEDITPVDCKNTSKSQKNNSPTRKKSTSESKKNSRSDSAYHGKTLTGTKRLHSKVSTNTRNSLMWSSDSSSCESDTEARKRTTNSAHGRRTTKSELKPSEGKKKASPNDESNHEEIVPRNKSKKTSTSGATSSRKSIKTLNDDNSSLKSSESVDEEDTDIESHRETRKSLKSVSRNSTSKQNGGSKKSTKNDDSRWKKTRRDESKRLKRDDDSSEKNEDSNEIFDGKSKKSSHLRRLTSQNAASDSSSGKEFRKSKLFRNSYVPLKRISELEHDYTKISDDGPESPKDLFTKDETFALKNSVTYFFDELKRAANKLINDIEVAQTQYCMKDSMRPIDVDRMILKTKNVVSTLKQSVDHGENRIDGYYEKWCKKTRARNILKTKRRSNEHENALSSSAKQSPIKSSNRDYFGNESEPSSRVASPTECDNGIASPAESIITNGAADCTVVSDCNSEEIFSGVETGNLARNTRRNSQSKRDGKSATPDPKNNKTRRDDDEISSDDTVDNDSALQQTDASISKNRQTKTLNGSSTSMALSEHLNRQPELDLKKFAEKSSLSCNNETSRNSINSSDVDMFETTTEVIDDEINKEKTLNESDKKDNEIEKKSTEKTSKGTKTTTKDENSSRSSSKVEEMDKNNMEIESSDDEKSVKKTRHENSEKSNEMSLSTETDVDVSDKENAESNREEIVTDVISAELPENHDNNLTSDDQSTTNERSSKSSVNDCPVHKNTVEVQGVKSPLHAETVSDEKKSADREIQKKCDAKSMKDDEDNGQSIYSLETIEGDKHENYIENDLKSPTMVDDNDDQSSLDDEKSLSTSPNRDLIDKLSSLETVVACENNAEEESSKSSEHDTRERRSSLDTVIAENIDGDIEKSSSNSLIIDEERSPLTEQPNGVKCDKKVTSKSMEVNNLKKRSSTDVLLADLETTNEKSTSKSRSDASRSSTSSNPSETDDLRVRDMLLMSSNSDDSSVEDLLTLQKSDPMENSEASPASSKSDSKSCESTNKNEGNFENEKTQQAFKTKRKKFHIEDNPHLMADKQLSQRCEVSLIRLEKKIIARHSRALKNSRDYVDSQKLKRLVALDDLDKKKKNAKNSDSEDEHSSSKDLKNKKKSRATKEREETLLDYLKKVENGESIELNDLSDSEQSDEERKGTDKLMNQIEDSLFAEADRMAKKRLLESSDSAEEEPNPSEPQEKENEKNEEKEEKTKKTKKVGNPEKLEKPSENEKEKQDKAEKGRWRKNKILTLRISDTDSEEEKKTFDLSQEKLSKEKDEESQSDSGEEETPKKKRVRRRVLHSDSDVEKSPPSSSDTSDDSIKRKKKSKKNKDSSDDDTKKKIRKRVRRDESGASSSDSLEQRRPKNRRKRIKTAASDSDSDLDTTQGTPGKSGRKNIRKVIRDKQVADDTKQAAKDEEERLQRIAERQKLYNQMYENRLAGEKKVDKLVLDFDEETKEPLVSVDEALVKRLKPHQAQGIKFMWDACFESLERTKTTKGSGCILAHCMGLGKTFQIVALSHTLLQHEETGIKTIMVVCPLSTVLNWVNEFKIWLENLPDGDDIEVYELTKMKKNFERKYQLQRWQKTGGVMIIGYEMFRNLSNAGKKVRKNIQEVFSKALVDPGPDLIVCDEGHLLKNEDTALSKAMRRVRTLRRIVLTGTPLQNNLIEYHCMVQFVKPNLLGTKKEFTNRFENPITNGQFDDSTEYDVRLMKKRAHVLHKMLEGSVQRLDYSVLTPFLPPKQEYVIFVKLTETQIKMYRHYLDNYARRHRGVGGSLFADFQALQRIWTHPLVMQMNAKKVELANEKKRLDATDSEGSLRDFIDDGSDSNSSDVSDVQSVSGSEDDSKQKPKRGTRANPAQDEPVLPGNPDKPEENNDDHEWWTQFVKDEDYEDIRISSKLSILFAILKESHSIGDKVLVFSQSLYSLTLIEEFLRLIDDATQNGNYEPKNLENHTGSWCLGLDYFRLDGQSSTDNRRRWCDIFNKPSNTRARLFLISTRAGGLGINLTAANRVIIFDASWNPSHDVQSIFRIYRFGQKKPCYVYRLLAAGTMEEKIYNRQVTKLSLSCRVVDEQQIERHYSNNALAELYKLEISETEHTLNLPKDRLLAEIFLKYKHCVENYHEHDSLLENQAGEELDEEERQQAWLEYEEEKKGHRPFIQNPVMTYQNELLMQQMNLINMGQSNPAITNPAMMLDYENIKQMMAKDYPGVSEAQKQAMATRTVYEMYNYVERQALARQNPMAMMNLPSGPIGFKNRIIPQNLSAHPTPEMIRLYQQSLVQQQNGQMNFPINHGITNDSLGHMRNQTIAQIPQLSSQSSAIPTAVDDDIVEIPASPEKNLVSSTPVPGGSRKSQEE